MNGNAQVYTVFVSPGYGGAGGIPEELVTNDQLLQRLEDRVQGTDFVGRDLTKGDLDLAFVLRELESLQDDLDGVLVIGTSRKEEYELALTGLPTIVVYNLFEFMHLPYELYSERGRILTACLDRRNAANPAITSAMFDDLVAKLELIRVLRQMKESRIISVSPYERFAIVDYKHLPPGYNKSLTNALDEYFGIDLVKVDVGEFYEAVKEVRESEATAIAQTWHDGAQGVGDTAQVEVVQSAKMYLALETLRGKYHAAAVSSHMRSLTGSGRVEDMAWPSLANAEFQKRGIMALCQDYPHLAATHLLAHYLVGRPSMLGDLMIDPFNEVSIILHCGAPLNPHGNDSVPYVLRSHAESPVRGTLRPGSGACLQVELPIDELVTIWKIDVINKRILIHTGKTVDGRVLYPGLDDIMCRTKLIAKTDTATVQRHVHMDRYGLHRAVTYGDLRERIKDVALLIGFDVVEEDAV